MALKLQIRRDTSVQWTSINPLLQPGEMGFETDTRRLKIGTSIPQAWNSLPYIVVPLEPHTHDTDDINYWSENILVELFNLIGDSDTVQRTFDAEEGLLRFEIASVINQPIVVNNVFTVPGVNYKINYVNEAQGEINLDISDGQVFVINVLDDISITTNTIITPDLINLLLVVNNPLNRQITWNQTQFNWANGEELVFGEGKNLIFFISFDGGTNWHNGGFIQNSKTKTVP